MIEFIGNIKNKLLELGEVLVNIVSSGDKVIEVMDGVTFDGTTQIYQFFSTFRYVLGDPLYLVLTSILVFGVSFMLFKLMKKGINGLLSFIPGFNIKLP